MQVDHFLKNEVIFKCLIFQVLEIACRFTRAYIGLCLMEAWASKLIWFKEFYTLQNRRVPKTKIDLIEM